MLRSSYFNQVFKKLAVPPLCESFNEVVEVELKDPNTGDSIGKHFDEISSVRQLSEESAVAHESADLYSIENMMSVGMSPVLCSPGGFIHNGLGAIERAEASAESMLNNLPMEESKND